MISEVKLHSCVASFQVLHLSTLLSNVPSYTTLMPLSFVSIILLAYIKHFYNSALNLVAITFDYEIALYKDIEPSSYTITLINEELPQVQSKINANRLSLNSDKKLIP